jgi:hypothetical protein
MKYLNEDEEMYDSDDSEALLNRRPIIRRENWKWDSDSSADTENEQENGEISMIGHKFHSLQIFDGMEDETGPAQVSP